MSVGIYDLSPQQLIGIGGGRGKKNKVMAMTAFWVGGLLRHSDELSVCPLKRSAGINKKGRG